MATHDWNGNLAPDGYFIDLGNEDVVRPLQTGYGFNKQTFEAAVPSTIYTASALTATAIQAALNSASAGGGGIVRLPAGTGNINTQINVPSKVLVEGAGQTLTRLTWTGTSGFPFKASDKKNIVLRDFNLDSVDKPVYGIAFECCTNVMLERVTSRRGKNGQVNCRFVDGVTIRYCNLSDATTYHGIAIKDIFENGALRNEAYCDSQFEAFGSTYGAYFTQNYAIYSNYTNNNPGRGINCHAINGEIAGNWSNNNGQGNKSFDGRNVLIHHNYLANSGQQGWSLAATIDFAGRTIGYITFCENQFVDNPTDIGVYDTSAIGSWTYSGPVVLRNNTYSPSGSIRSPGSDVVKVCTGSSGDTGATWTGAYGTADEENCGGCGGVVAYEPAVGCDDTTLLANGSFDDGATSWELSTDGDVEIDASAGALVVTVADWGSATEVNQAPLSVMNGDEYELKVLIHASAPTSVGVQLVDDTTPATGLGLDATIAVGTTAAIYSTQFSASSDSTNARLRFVITDDVEITIGEVCLRPVATGTIDANFTASTLGGTAPLLVAFVDQSIADNTITAWVWKANGVVFATTQNPSYTFPAAGGYSIELTVTSSDGSSTLLKSNLITVTTSASGSGDSLTIPVVAGAGASGGDQTVTVAAGGDDGYWEPTQTAFQNTPNTLRVGKDPSASTERATFLTFQLTADIPAGATIVDAHLDLYCDQTPTGSGHSMVVSVDDSDDSSAPSSASNADGRTWIDGPTWADTFALDTRFDSPNLDTEIQQLVDTYGGLASGAGITFKLRDANAVANNRLVTFESYEGASAAGDTTRRGNLYIEWTGASAGGADVERNSTVGLSADGVGVQLRPSGSIAFQFVLTDDIPSDATMTDVRLRLGMLSPAPASYPSSITIQAEDTDDAAAFTDSTDYDGRTLSSASVSWILSTWTVGGTVDTPNLAALIQELVDSYTGLANGAVISLRLTYGGSGDDLKFSSLETGVNVAQLYLEWDQTGGSSGDTFTGSQALQVATGADDCERRATGFDVGLTGLRVYPDAGAVAGIGMRFVLAQDVPANATIEDAYLSVYVSAAGSTVDDMTLRAQLAADPGQFSDATDFDARTQSTTNVAWSPSTWTLGDWKQSPDIKTLLQDVVDNYGPLPAGTAIVIFLKNETSGSGYIKFASREYGAEYAPKLDFSWSVPANRPLLKEFQQPLRFGLRSGLGM